MRAIVAVTIRHPRFTFIAHDAVSQDHLRRCSPSCLCITRALSAFLHRYGSNTSTTCCEEGLAQGIAVSANTTIIGFSFWITSPAQNLKFFIFDRGTNAMLYESQKLVGVTVSGTSVKTVPFFCFWLAGSRTLRHLGCNFDHGEIIFSGRDAHAELVELRRRILGMRRLNESVLQLSDLIHFARLAHRQ